MTGTLDGPGARTQVLQHRVPVHARQVEVEQDHVGIVPVDLFQRLHPVGGLDDRVPFALEEVLHDAAELILVLHQQDRPLPVRAFAQIERFVDQLERGFAARPRAAPPHRRRSATLPSGLACDG